MIESAFILRASATRLWLRLIQGAPDPPPLVTPQWKWLWPILAAALAIRIMQAAFSDWAMRPDVAMQQLEQAHRLVFGYGFVPWEFRFGVRTWLIPAIVSPPLFLVRALDLDDPNIYIPLVNMWNAVLSMAVPAGMYFYMRRMVSEQAARTALLFGCFWYEFLIFAPQALAESYAAALFMGGLALSACVRRSRWLFMGGLLLGLAIAVRVPYGLGVVVCGGFWLASLPLRRWQFPLAGGACGLLLWGAVDYMTWGGWWDSIINYVKLVPMVFVSSSPPYYNVLALAIASFGLYALYFACGLWSWRRHVALLAMALAVYAPSLNPYSQEYSNMFLLFPLLWMLAAGVIANWNRWLRVALFAAASSVSVAGLAYKLPYMSQLRDHGEGPLLFRNSDAFLDTRAMHVALEGEDVRAVAWTITADQISMGGYYQLHRDVPIYLPLDARHVNLIRDREVTEVFSHVVSFNPIPPPGFSLLPHPAAVARGFFIYRNNSPENVSPIKDYVYDMSMFFHLAGGQYYEYEPGPPFPPAPVTPFYD